MPIQRQIQHTQSLLTAPTDPVTTVVQGHYQPPKMNAKLLVQVEHAEDASRTFTTPYQQMMTAVVRRDDMIWVSRGTVAGSQGPSHFVNVTSPTAVSEDLIHGVVPPSEISSGLGDDAGTGSVADTNTLGPRASSPPTLQTQLHVNTGCAFAPGAQPLATIPQHVLPHDSGIGQRQQSILRGIASDRWTGILCWQCRREGAWFQVQAVAADGIRNPCVYSFVICKLVKDSYPRRMFFMWPRILQIQLVETAISSQDVQAWILKTRTPVARIKGKSGDSHQFGDLVKLVRSGSVSRRSRSPVHPLTP